MGDRFLENDGLFLSPLFPWNHNIVFHISRYQCELPMKEFSDNLELITQQKKEHRKTRHSQEEIGLQKYPLATAFNQRLISRACLRVESTSFCEWNSELFGMMVE